MKSIYFIAVKEIICALFIVAVFQYINFDYYTTINAKNLEGREVEEVEEILVNYKAELRAGIGLIFLVVIHILQRVLFKIMYKQKQNHQIWFYTDIVICLANFSGMLYLSGIDAESAMDSN